MYKLFNRFVEAAIGVLSRYKDKQEVNSYINSVRSSCKILVNQADLTKEQEKEIQLFYSPLLGHSVPTDWHKYFYSRTGIFSKFYIPTSEYKTNIVGRLNIYPLKRAYTDKNITDLILPSAHQPRVYLKNMNGYFYYEGRAVSKEDAISLCGDLGDVIIKPSLTGRGVGVRRITIKNKRTSIDNFSLDEVFTMYEEDFLIEEVIHQHQRMSMLNPSSINTIRVVTFRDGMDILIVYSVIRIGRKDKPIDNESAGGISTRINADGTLGKYAYGAPGDDKIEYTDSGIKLEGYEIPSYHKVIEQVKEYHYQLPYFDLMGWDMAVEEDGTPILIEFNMTPDLSQSANGPAFGEYTELILKRALSKKNTWSRIALESMWRKNRAR